MSFLDRIMDAFERITRHEDHYIAVVRAGDSLWGMVEKLYPKASKQVVSNRVNMIVEINDIENPDLIQPGDEIKIPKEW